MTKDQRWEIYKKYGIVIVNTQRKEDKNQPLPSDSLQTERRLSHSSQQPFQQRRCCGKRF
ncbi:hypothetical protein ACFO25_05370 [Paenactinomyces guangxiensis]|uniref:Uncharacterized protein n=1 Tax=Paenactinomyces guangxiensis TaxID=1490290 RepID=A0A7W1WQQ9_9BACL|nr:hypothetical protein [Paenactinomyces guangxiensis]MBA4494337.1 hypothetical protein [Paenactinomyces guangxiensis]MBH8590832.1 hypothetical protein [Paenactinomyces guangxiensis]